MVLLLRHVLTLGEGRQQSVLALLNCIYQGRNLGWSVGVGREGVEELFSVDLVHECHSLALLVFVQTDGAQLLPELLYALAYRIKHYQM